MVESEAMESVLIELQDVLREAGAESKVSDEYLDKLVKDASLISHGKKKLEDELDEEEDMIEKSKRTKRSIIKESSLWEKGIVPYTFDEGERASTESQRKNVLRIQNSFESLSCLKFVPWTDSVNKEYNLSTTGFLMWGQYNIDSGVCYSFVGKLNRPTGQKITSCAVTHELGHAIGLGHEQQRPDRDRYLKAYPENVQEGRESTTKKKPYGKNRLLNPYDLGSSMHYGLKSFTKNKKLVFDVLDKSEKFLMGSDYGLHGLSYYDRMQINLGYNCVQLRCPGLKLRCENDGFPAVINGECKCACPPSLGGPTCEDIYRGPSKLSQWPEGKYGIPKAQGGCPDGQQWTAGSRSQAQYKNKGQFTGEVEALETSLITNSKITQQFCMHSGDENSEAQWTKGQYCIYQGENGCPKGFESGSLTFDDNDESSTSSGSLPKGEYDGKTKIYFCCREDGSIQEELHLPTDKPFTLLPLAKNKCQKVAGMRSTYDVRVRFGRKSGDDSQYEVEGLLPYILGIHTSSMHFYIYYCYYYPIRHTCGGIIDLSETKTPVTITSPNFPNHYDKETECTWLVKGPSNSLIRFELEEMDIEEDGDVCADFLEIREHLPGQLGQRYCGEFSSYDKTFTSKNNSMILSFQSGLRGSGKGFKGRVSLIKENDLCYPIRDDGETYRGTRNYTQSYTPCLNWEQVSHCPYNAFTTSSISDGLGNHNSCRNPGGVLPKPWCYTQAEDCKQDMCDVCLLDGCHDIYPDCKERIAEDPNYCRDEETAIKGCHKSCGHCEERESGFLKQCLSAPTATDATPIDELKSSYYVGETVRFRCTTGDGIFTRQCLADGRWSGLDTVCTGCSPGFEEFDGSCYQLFSSQKAAPAEGEEFCSQLGHHLLYISSEKETEYLVNKMISNKISKLGLGIEKSADGTWKWFTGKTLEEYGISNWYSGSKSSKTKTAARLRQDGTWDIRKPQWAETIMCKGQVPERKCVDLQDCQQLLERVPDLCINKKIYSQAFCRETCGLCPNVEVQCKDPAISSNTEINSNSGNQVYKIGDTIEYGCKEGFELVDGSRYRTCLKSGSFSGKSPICKLSSEVPHVLGDTVIDRESNVKPKTVTVDKNYIVKHDGIITKWKFYSRSSGKVSFLAYRREGTSSNFVLLGQNTFTTHPERVMTVAVPDNDLIYVKKGDYLGWYSDSSEHPIEFDKCSNEYLVDYTDVIYEQFKVKSTDLSVGSVMPLRIFDDGETCRIYSVQAFINPGVEE